ncbi:MAG: CpsD/CapB family tyrosine-protein kinase [bacterium]|nr:CpsD/CapB family tyrosine-protein kinase [bacterium]MCP5068283.1 CpsD/CapB family tyrosine-protein kinase [bacterium]
MGKVYDALRRAEEQRTRNVSEVSGAPAAPIAREPAPQNLAAPLAAKSPPMPAVPKPPARAGLLARWFRRSKPGEDTAADFNKRRIALLQPESFVTEQFRTLRARLDSIAATTPIRTLAVTSTRSGEGKTLSSLSLAIVSSMNLDSRVLLVDCDLRLPTVHKSLGVRPDAGLAEVLMDQASPEEAILRVEGTELDVLPVRAVPANPAELLASDKMKTLLESLAQRYDRVILDLPCTLGLPDAKTVSELCDGVVFVVRADRTPQDDVMAAIEILDRRRILGVVLNGAEAGEPYGPYARPTV